MDDVVTQDRLWIDGGWAAPATAEVIDVVGAATGQVIGHVPHAAAADLDAAVGAARRAFDDPGGWSRWEPARRAEVLTAFADALERRADAIVRAVSRQNGMPISIGAGSEGVAGPTLLRYYAAVASAQEAESERARLGGGRTLVRQAPLGVVAAVVPWNFPISLAFFKIAPALAAGCTVVWKPSPETVLDAYEVIAASAEAGLPPGVLNLVPGGRETGAALVAHPGVDKVAFTGSTGAGRAIAEVCGRLLRPVTLELGGKSAAIVLDDADLAAHAAALFGATLLNNGQTCYLSTRLLLPRNRYDEFVDTIADLVAGLVVGDPLDPATQVGPVATAAQRDRVEGFLAGARTSGRIVTGGGRPEGLAPGLDGWFVDPTVVADVEPDSRLAREEVFGPVLALMPYDDVDHAVALANDSEYGLAGTVWTQDAERGLDVMRRLRTGAVGLNGFRLDLGAPFGGLKASGLGSELGPEALSAYRETTTLYAAFA